MSISIISLSLLLHVHYFPHTKIIIITIWLETECNLCVFMCVNVSLSHATAPSKTKQIVQNVSSPEENRPEFSSQTKIKYY